MPPNQATILDVVLACRRVGKFLSGVGEPEFLGDDEKQWAVVSQLMLIGEAVRRLSEQYRTEHSQIPWSQYAGMRNRLIHQYDAINWTLVWKTASQEIPDLLAYLEPQLPAE